MEGIDLSNALQPTSASLGNALISLSTLSNLSNLNIAIELPPNRHKCRCDNYKVKHIPGVLEIIPRLFPFCYQFYHISQ